MKKHEMTNSNSGAVCEWFALCDEAADGVVAHPILDPIPTCTRCATELGLEFS
jgi:hypothetical protein